MRIKKQKDIILSAEHYEVLIIFTFDDRELTNETKLVCSALVVLDTTSNFCKLTQVHRNRDRM